MVGDVRRQGRFGLVNVSIHGYALVREWLSHVVHDQISECKARLASLLSGPKMPSEGN